MKKQMPQKTRKNTSNLIQFVNVRIHITEHLLCFQKKW